MEEMEVYTDEQWGKDGTFSAKPGQFVEDSVFYQLRDCVPPLHCCRDYMQVGEAYGYDFDKHCTTYTTFVKEGGRWKFIGELGDGEGRPKLKTFFDLKFEPHAVAEVPEYSDHRRAVMEFGNGYGISVLCGRLFYSDGETTYEVAVTKGGEVCETTPIADDVIGYLTIPEVTEIMARIQRL